MDRRLRGDDARGGGPAAGSQPVARGLAGGRHGAKPPGAKQDSYVLAEMAMHESIGSPLHPVIPAQAGIHILRRSSFLRFGGYGSPPSRG
jgi:hypothetical protein